MSRVTIGGDYIEIKLQMRGIVYYLAFGQDEFVIYRGGYLRDVDAYFKRFRDHEAVQIPKQYFSDAKTIPRRDYKLFAFDAYLLQFSNPPEMKMPYTEWQDPELDKIVDV